MIYLCSLERFISNSLQDRKKLQINYTHKSSVWVIVRRGGDVRSARWDSVGCVSMWWYMYIEGYILFFEILRIRGLSMFRFACFCLLGVLHFLHYFTFSPIYDFSYEKFLFFFFLFCFLIKNDFLIRNKIKKHIS